MHGWFFGYKWFSHLFTTTKPLSFHYFTTMRHKNLYYSNFILNTRITWITLIHLFKLSWKCLVSLQQLNCYAFLSAWACNLNVWRFNLVLTKCLEFKFNQQNYLWISMFILLLFYCVYFCIWHIIKSFLWNQS